jgi:hypothetical protein
MEGVTLANNVDAALDQIEAQQTIELPENGTSLNLLQQVYRNPSLPLPTRMRAAGMALPHEHPKLAVAVMVNAGDFATQLDQAIQRSRTIIEGKPTTMIEHDDTSTAAQRLHAQASNGGKPTIVDRRYRRW